MLFDQTQHEASEKATQSNKNWSYEFLAADKMI